MRGRWQLIGASLAVLAITMAAPALAAADDQWVFRAPLARPTDQPDPNSRHAYSVPEAPRSPACSRHFCVHWVEEGIDAPRLTDVNGSTDGDGVPDFVERVLKVAEHVHTVENEQLGWRDPKSDGRKGGRRGKTDVYLKQIGGTLFGYAAPDRGQAGKDHRLPRKLYGYLVLDNDYNRSEFPGTKPFNDLAVTFAHEYAHILQFGYDAYQDAWFAESTAVWMEDQVYDGINDYLRYVRRWTKLFATPLTANSIREYGTAVWNQWLARRYGQSIVRKAWAGAIDAKPGGFSVASYGRALRAGGGGEFSREFARFARDLPEWRTARAFPEAGQYRDVARQGNLPPGGKPLDLILNHTTFQLLRVHPNGGRPVIVRAVAPRGVAAAVALVGRIGSERHGHVISKLRYRRGGGPMAVRLPRPGRFNRITAVLVNADSSARGFSARSLDWNYLTDRVPFRVRAVPAR
ncbi:MAG TPA: MXAN_6640 family putative metalloprotease [Solirubrobacterales bacterium]|nr:MXAN_6640 family putative metalloprotease [Solirubrobacterales bacterium]